MPNNFLNCKLSDIDLSECIDKDLVSNGIEPEVFFKKSGLEIVFDEINGYFGKKTIKNYFFEMTLTSTCLLENKIVDFILYSGKNKNKVKIEQYLSPIYETLRQENEGLFYFPGFFYYNITDHYVISELDKLSSFNSFYEILGKIKEKGKNKNNFSLNEIKRNEVYIMKNEIENVSITDFIKDINENFRSFNYFNNIDELRKFNNNEIERRNKLLHNVFKMNFFGKESTTYLLSLPILAGSIGKKFVKELDLTDNKIFPDKYLNGQGACFLFFELESKNFDLNKFKEKFVPRVLSIVKDITYNYLFYTGKELSEKTKAESLKSAISAIMSRNMSHNLGSHVLSTAGNESVSAADDRMLDKYIQHRMDYIAQVSTEIPKWTTSAWFLSDLMKRFYMQNHLLEYIGKSEGLNAYTWDEKSLNSTAIKINIIDKDGNYIIDGDSGETTDGLNDIQVDVPGGVVGYHAFYTIIENVIRNSAKHDWTKNKEGNLEVTIKIGEPEGKDYYEIKIFDNCSNVYNNMYIDDEGKKNWKEVKPNDEEKWDADEQPLHWKISKIISDSFIDDVGKLKKSNWGLGEMRISAGFLIKKNYSEIGLENKDRLLNSNEDKGFIQPYVENKHNLGYRLKLMKPKYVLIIGKTIDGENELQTTKELEKILNNNGVYLKEKLTNKDFKQGLNFNFILFLKDGFDNFCKDFTNKETYLEKLPCRVLTMNNDLDTSKFDIPKEVINRRIVKIQNDGFLKKLNKIRKLNKSGIEIFKIYLYEKWLENLVRIKYKGKKIKLFIKTSGDTLNLNDDRIVDEIKKRKRLFYHNVFYRYKKRNEKMSEDFTKVFNENISIEKLFRNNEIISKEKLGDIYKNKESKNKLNQIITSYLPDLSLSFNQFMENFLIYAGIVFKSMKTTIEDLVFKYEEKIKTLPKKLRSKENDRGRESKIDGYSITICLNNKEKILDDKINNYCEGKAEKNKNHLIFYNRHLKENDIENLINKKIYAESLSGSQLYYNILEESCDKNTYKGKIFRRELYENGLLSYIIIDERVSGYVRKNNNQIRMKAAQITVPEAFIYGGSIHEIIECPYCFIDKNGKIDEDKSNKRFNKEINKENKSNIKEIFDEEKLNKLNKSKKSITIGGYFLQKKGDKEKYKIIIVKKELVKNFENIDDNGDDIFIIHQGIVDKMKLTKKEKQDLMNYLKSKIPFVYVTSGRGRPDSIPGNVRFLPFSSIESTLLKDYHEKYLLTNTVMKVFLEEKKNEE